MKNLQIDEAVNNYLDEAVNNYQEALENFKAFKASRLFNNISSDKQVQEILDKQVLGILNARDRVDAALSEPTQVCTNTLKKF